MIFALIIVLIAITFGYTFAKLDILTKASKMLRDELQQVKVEIDKLKVKQ